MPTRLNLPSIKDQTAFKLYRWDVLCSDRYLARTEVWLLARSGRLLFFVLGYAIAHQVVLFIEA